MAAATDKVLDRIEKLLRLAAPSSGAPEPERASAALEAARLFAEYDLTVKMHRGRTRRSDTDRDAWVLSMALQWRSCARCHRQISREDIVWIRVRSPNEIEYVHNYPPCNADII